MEESEESTPVVRETEAEIKHLLGLFDSPAFVRRGQDLEYALVRLRQRLARERDGMLDMVRVRLRQWAACATGPDDFADVLDAPVVPLWPLTLPLPPATPTDGRTPPTVAGPYEPSWAAQPAPTRRRRAVARDLAASVTRFNRRWSEFLERMTFDAVNRQIDLYNRYYVLEKECVLGSARLATRHFQPRPLLSAESLLAEFPPLPVPALRSPS